MNEQTFDISAPVNYVRSRRARRLRITIRPEPAVTVTIPQRGSLEEARQFLASKEAWIRKHLEQIAQRRQQTRHEAPPELPDIDLDKAQDVLFERLAQLSRQHNLPYRRAAFRCQRTKWGSCSSQNNISLNINIVFLPEHLQDYILLHELLHVRHKNHSPRFWDELSRLCGRDARRLRDEMKKHCLKIKA